MRRLIALCVLVAIAGCAPRAERPREGFLEVPGGRVWYRIVGSGKQTPLLLLHGGPGVPSYYMNPLAKLGDERPVVFYDQLGCGRSDRPADSTLWTIDHFVNELAEVRKQLGLAKVHLLGHSWGTILAAEYLRTHPSGVESVILASPANSIPRWIVDADSLLLTMPDSTQAVIAANERAGTTQSPAYQGAMMEFYHRYVSRSQPWGPDIDSTFAGMGQTVYLSMCGPSEFTITGSLKTYEGGDALAQIRVPTLFTIGRYDEVPLATAQYYQGLVPGAKLEIFENSAHLTMQDEPDRYVEVVREFLRSVEGANRR
jgi:proline iminopeptidase